MTKKDLQHIEDLRSWCLRHGYKKSSRTDAYEKDGTGGIRWRMKFNKISLRMEGRHSSDRSAEWRRTRSGYYKDLYITPATDKLGGLK